MIAENDHIKKVDLKRGELISSGVYPSWHPSENMIAYSVNSTNQVFLRNDRQRLEVYDSASDIILYDIDNDEISPVLCDNRSLETFPAWSYDGKVLFYASADLDSLGIMPDENVADRYDDIRYSIKAIRYDAEKGTFSTPVSIFDAPADCLSAVTPRPSPDGRFVLSAVGSYGSFHIWHDDSDLYITNLEDGETQPLDGANSPRADSFHSWSSNSRWIVFASRRDDRTYSRLYISYIDEHGKASKPFLLPQSSSALPARKADLINYLWPRFLEYGKDLCFMKSQDRINFGELVVDLVLYHRGLKCIVPVMIGRGAITQAIIDKMDRILYYYTTEDRRDSGGNPPFGIIANRQKEGWLVDLYSYQDSVDFYNPDIEKEIPTMEQLQKILG